MSHSYSSPQLLSRPREATPLGTAIFAHLELMRPANMVTAAADVLAGYAAVLNGSPANLPWLLVSTLALYAGGVTMNDFFDRELDAVERPERPIPSGRVNAASAALLGSLLLALGVLAGFRASLASGSVAASIALAALAYNTAAKHHRLAGPALMGLCRGLNLLLGVTAAPAMLAERSFLPLLSVTFVAAITAMSAGEVHGGSRRTAAMSLALFGAVAAGLLALAVHPDVRLAAMAPFLFFLGWRVGPPVWRAWLVPEPARIRVAVRAGVLSLIALDAAIGAGLGGALYGAAILSLMIPGLLLARLFSVT